MAAPITERPSTCRCFRGNARTCKTRIIPIAVVAFGATDRFDVQNVVTPDSHIHDEYNKP
jgi:hypothetical protein